MIRMLRILRVVVHTGMIESIAAVPGFVYVHSIEITSAGKPLIGKAENLCFYQDTAVGRVIKFDHAAQVGILCVSFDPRSRIGLIV